MIDKNKCNFFNGQFVDEPVPPKQDIRELYDMNKYKDNITGLATDLIKRYPEIQWLTSKTNVTPEGIISSKVHKDYVFNNMIHSYAGPKTLSAIVWRDSHRV